MVRRLFDLVVAGGALLCAGPVIAVAAIGVKLSSSGPAFFKASRVGQGGNLFIMYKLRTMHCRETAGSSITAAEDPRVFLVGKILRVLKIDELPQLLNIVKGEMAIVGPRPEAPDIVENHYTDEYHRSLDVPPGLTSPGSIYYYTHGEQILAEDGTDAEELYLQRLLPRKMAIDLEYLDRATLQSDLGVMLRTASVLIQKALGRTTFPQPASVTSSASVATTVDSTTTPERRAA
jgi:lipopolysaccharide/colanic/teichoic acid biosynthesis glycosyltransferase